MSFGFSEDSILTSTSALEQQHCCSACFKDSPLCVATTPTSGACTTLPRFCPKKIPTFKWTRRAVLLCCLRTAATTAEKTTTNSLRFLLLLLLLLLRGTLVFNLLFPLRTVTKWPLLQRSLPRPRVLSLAAWWRKCLLPQTCEHCSHPQWEESQEVPSLSETTSCSSCRAIGKVANPVVSFFGFDPKFPIFFKAFTEEMLGPSRVRARNFWVLKRIWTSESIIFISLSLL